MCAEFLRVYRHGGIEQCTHILTWRYPRLDHKGKCFVPAGVGWKEVAFEDEWKRVSGRA